MVNLIRVEVRKILAQRMIAFLLVWLWPIGGIVLPLFIVALTLLRAGATNEFIQPTFQWTDIALGVWNIPTNLFGRLLFIALASAIFTSEYEWRTWKIIIPRADRIRLVLAKYAAFTLLLVIAIVLLSVLLTGGIGIIQSARGLGNPPAMTDPIMAKFIGDYILQIGLTVINTLIGVAFGAILATLTRSILGGIIGGILFVAGEIGFVAGVTTVAIALNSPQIAGLARFTASLSVANIQSWSFYSQPVMPLMEGAPTNTPFASFIVLAVWLVALITVNLWLFQRQDLT